MTLTKKRIICAVIFAIAIVPASALALVKPLRVVFPQLVSGVSCYDGGICTDDRERLGEIRALYNRALLKTQEKVGDFHSRPNVTFCSTLPAARTIGTFGVIVAPRGWQEFYLIHEFIHYRQAEELGMLSARRKPSWLMEGMAYSLSGDPRKPLSPPFESWRNQFNAWYVTHQAAGIWTAAREVR